MADTKILNGSFILRLGGFLGEGNGNPLQYSCLENPMDRGAWLAILQGVANSRTRLSDFTLLSKTSWLIGKDSDAGRDWGQEEKGTTEDEMAGWHHRLHGHEFGWFPGVGDGQGGLVLQFMGSHRSDTTEWLNWTELNWCQGTMFPIPDLQEDRIAQIKANSGSWKVQN